MVVSICISPMTGDVEHLFHIMLGICVSSLDKCILKFFAQFVIRLFVFCLLSCFLNILNINCLSDTCLSNQIFSLILFGAVSAHCSHAPPYPANFCIFIRDRFHYVGQDGLGLLIS